jgi:hypothetical protein
MPMDRAGGRAELWRRYDAGELTADELEARLRLVDRVDDDADVDAVRAAVDGPVPLRRRRSTRRVALVAAAALGALALLGGVLVVADAVSDDGGGATTPFAGSGFAGPVGTVVVDPGVPPPPPVACEDLAPREDISGEAAANPALLSDPPFAPEGYEHGDDDAVAPGTDPDIAMSTAAGNPLPVEIAARELDGDLVVRLRTFRFASTDDARASAASVSDSACSFGATRFDVPDRPEIAGTVVSGPIPTTAFASWHLGDRRFIVAVESEGDDPDDLAEAQALAGTIAAAELESARTPPPPS